MRKLAIILFGIVLICGGRGVLAEERALSAEEEKKIEEQEDAAGDEAMKLQLKTVFTGRISLDSADTPSDRGVVGSLLCDDNKVYPLKVASNEVLTQLKEYDGKKTTVTGKLRVNGKYLVVTALVISNPPAESRSKKKRNGL